MAKEEIEKLEKRNRILNVQIAQLNKDNLTKDEQKIIDGHLQEIAINENEIRKLRKNKNN